VTRRDIYVGLTSDVRRRLERHNAGQNVPLPRIAPGPSWSPIEFANEVAAVHFERYLKSGSGRALPSGIFLKRGSQCRREARASRPQGRSIALDLRGSKMLPEVNAWGCRSSCQTILVKLARKEAGAADRSITSQIEHWAKLGRAVESALGHVDVLALKGARGNLTSAFPGLPSGKRCTPFCSKFRHVGSV